MDARVGSEARAREILMGPALGLMSRLALTNQDYGAGNLDGILYVYLRLNCSLLNGSSLDIGEVRTLFSCHWVFSFKGQSASLELHGCSRSVSRWYYYR